MGFTGSSSAVELAAQENLEQEDADFEIDLSSPKPGHTTGGSGRRGARRSIVGRGEAGQNRVPTFRSARKPTVPLPPAYRKQVF